MKPLPPLVVPKPFILDPNSLQFRYYFLAGFAFLFGATALGGSIHLAFNGIYQEWYAGAAATSTWFGFAFLALGKLASRSQKNQAELTQQLKAQDERIQQLEAQIATLTAQRTTPN